MNLERFFEQFYLHDSGIENYQYLPAQQQLILAIDLCNYMQDNYQETQPETIMGQLIFSGVKMLASNPDINQVEWGEKSNGQILNVSVSNLNNSQDEQVEMLLEVIDYLKNNQTTFLVTFQAFDVHWIPN